MRFGTYLNVPYLEKNVAKAVGAKWDSYQKRWFVPDGMDLSLFEQWLPMQNSEFTEEVKGPFYLIRSWERCWRCKRECRVYALSCSALSSKGLEEKDKNVEISGGVLILNRIRILPTHIEKFFKQYCATYYMDDSRNKEATCIMNHCHCGAKIGEFFIHDKEGGAFYQKR